MATVIEEEIETPPAIAAPPIERRRFTADEFERMAEVGIIGDQERVELIEGDVIVMSRIGSPHAACVKRYLRYFSTRIAGRATLGIQDPIRLSDYSEPEPDIVLIRPRDDDYASGHPKPADVFLLIEVMDTSIYYDRKIKLPLYARSGIPEVWLTDVHGEFIEAHGKLSDGVYAEMRIFRPGETIAPAAFPDLILAVSEIVRR